MIYILNRGDVIWIDLNPRKLDTNRRQGDQHLFCHHKAITEKLVCVCFAQLRIKSKAIHLSIDSKKFSVTRVVLSDQIKNLDWKSRRAEFITNLPETVMNEVLKTLLSVL